MACPGLFAGKVDVLDLASCRWNPKSTDPTLTWDQQNTVEWWEAFKTLNTMFANHMTKMIRQDGKSLALAPFHDVRHYS